MWVLGLDIGGGYTWGRVFEVVAGLKVFELSRYGGVWCVI